MVSYAHGKHSNKLFRVAYRPLSATQTNRQGRHSKLIRVRGSTLSGAKLTVGLVVTDRWQV